MREVAGLLEDIKDNLPVLLRSIGATAPLPMGFQLPLDEAIDRRRAVDLHPSITFNDPFNAAANLAGAGGPRDPGEDRIMGGQVTILVDERSDGGMSGEILWGPKVHVNDLVRFCPAGNLGNWWQPLFTLPMSRLEAMGLTKEVPIVIDYDVDLVRSAFTNVAPLIGPLAPDAEH
jgi:hypothetical protein